MEVNLRVGNGSSSRDRSRGQGLAGTGTPFKNKQLLSNEAWREKSSRVGAVSPCRGVRSRKENSRHAVPSVFRSTYGPSKEQEELDLTCW